MNTRSRIQKGSLTLRSGNWYVRYWTGPKTDRKMVSHKLGPKDDVLHGRSSGRLRQLVEEHMAKVNSESSQEEERTIVGFWEREYLPWCEAEKKPSTLHSYKQIFQQHLKSHFGESKLCSYTAADASKLLTKLAKSGLGRNAVQHVRSLMSGIFSHAVRLGELSANPIREAGWLTKPKAPAPAEAYSLREVEDLVSALKDRPDMQLLVLLQAYLGLRPSECQGLAWDCVDLEKGEIHLRRGVVRGVVQDLKTPGSVASLPMISPVRALFERLPGERQTWVFENGRRNPACLKAFVWNVIRPAIARWNESHGPERRIKWRGMYGLRRTAASSMWSLTGGTEASQLLLRHTTPQTVNRHYLVADRSKMVAGLKMLEEKLRGRD